MGESFELLSEILDKMIDAQVQNAQVTTDLKNAVEENNRNLKELHDTLVKVNSHFSNGFRQELKTAISDAAEQIETQGHAESKKILDTLTDFTSALKNPKSWIGAFLLIASIFATIAGIVTVILKLMGGL